MCSTRREQQPTVSAWSSSFSLPALKANCGKKHYLQWDNTSQLGGFGMEESLEQLMITSSGMMRFLSIPCFGCSPRPRNNPGGSILKLPIRCLCPSMLHQPYSAIKASFCSLRAFFSSFVRDLEDTDNSELSTDSEESEGNTYENDKAGEEITRAVATGYSSRNRHLQ
ncbi:hypothetical protein E2C01_034380 [Portunus trituberculatus]|uniref:Uncharacterized protein n=1 Tax=Portunus trituberculatus TaxID=210409 RepID=A0A5B7F1G5_PORTR|nr:hypothetical protein [Portunus trituberculatus]